MTNELKGAGESRRSRRLALNSAAALIVALALLIAIGRGSAEKDSESWSVGSDDFQRTDAQIAEHLLQSVEGAHPVLCAAVNRAFNTGQWGETLAPPIDAAASEETAETARWIGKSRIHRDALPIARRGLASDDACTRRVAARIAGNIDVQRLAEELRAELESPVKATRIAAIVAIGYAEAQEALPLLQRLVRDADRDVRYAALWALGSLESKASVPILVPLLQSDPDAEIRRLAAWALGRLD